MSIDLEAIKGREAKATPEPWKVSNGGYMVCADKIPAYFDKTSRVVVADCMKENSSRKFEEAYAIAQRDAEFIAHARQDIPALLDRVEVLEKTLAAAKKDLARGGSCPHCAYNSRKNERTGFPICDKDIEYPNGECFEWRGP